MSWIEDIPDKRVRKYLYARIKKYNIPCLGYHSQSTPSSPPEFDCEYENSADFFCDHCVCNGGEMNPITGKRVYKKKGE
jgi:hypothetical protein